jgi:hypothetical protein
MLAIFPLFLLLGLFLPGFFLAKCLRHGGRFRVRGRAGYGELVL